MADDQSTAALPEKVVAWTLMGLFALCAVLLATGVAIMLYSGAPMAADFLIEHATGVLAGEYSRDELLDIGGGAVIGGMLLLIVTVAFAFVASEVVNDD